MADTTDQTAKFLAGFMFDGGLLQLSVGKPNGERSTWLERAPTRITNLPAETDVYFGPALRSREGTEKSDVLGSVYLWVDVDDPVMPEPTLPPSVVVSSGSGFHLYWRLSQPLTDPAVIEELNLMLIGDIPTADGACWNSNRLMRVPGTDNVHRRDKPPTRAELRLTRPYTYDADDIRALGKLDERTRQMIRTGDLFSHKSRSERDWEVGRELVLAGATDKLIRFIFAVQPVGDKTREASGEQYITHTISNLRQEYAKLEITLEDEAGPDGKKPAKRTRTTKGHASEPIQIVERSDGYYAVGTASRKISTFTLEPRVLLKALGSNEKDALVCHVKADGRLTPDVTFSRAAFTTRDKIDAACPNARWTWLGSDNELRLLLSLLLKKLDAKQGAEIAATNLLGLHTVDDQLLYLTHQEVVSSSQRWVGVEAPLTWLPAQREYPKCDLSYDIAEDEIARVAEYLPKLNVECAVWTMVGWHAAAILKPWIEQQGFRFPHLNITGTRGSGKTSLNRDVFMPLFSGQHHASVQDALTTTFVRLTLLSASNAAPIAFGEFREADAKRSEFIRHMLLAYDGSHAQRGRADQTTNEWALTTPLTIDGEDVIQDSAVRERMLLVRMRPETIAEQSPAWHAYREFIRRLPRGFARYFIQRALLAIESGDAAKLLQEAETSMYEAYDIALGDRVRRNYTVANFGMRLYQKIANAVDVPGPIVFKEGLGELVNLNSGRPRTLFDDFIEQIVNHGAQRGHRSFKWHYDRETRVFWYQMSDAYTWWRMQRRRQDEQVFGQNALIAMASEVSYTVPRAQIGRNLLYGVSLPKGVEYGLDIPNDIPELGVIPDW